MLGDRGGEAGTPPRPSRWEAFPLQAAAGRYVIVARL